MAVGDAYVFPVFLTPVLTELFFQKPPTTFPTCFCRGERKKYAEEKVLLNRGSNSQPPSHESDTLTNEPTGRGVENKGSVEGLVNMEPCVAFLFQLSIPLYLMIDSFSQWET